MNLELIAISLLIVIFSAILHEIAHGYVAERLGDPTAKLLGRLTLNPIPHIDPIMTILLPLLTFFSTSALGFPLVFGGAKPVPVDPFNLRDPKKDMALVSLAGPGTNFLIAAIFAIISHILFPGASLGQLLYASEILGSVIGLIITINLSLGIFNLLPIPPLDGSKVLASVLPDKYARTYLSIGSYGIIILLFLISPFSPIPLDRIISQIMNSILLLFRL